MLWTQQQQEQKHSTTVDIQVLREKRTKHTHTEENFLLILLFADNNAARHSTLLKQQ